MAVAQGSCPSCGASIEFGVGSSIAKICEYCRATVVRSDRGLENLGKVSEGLAQGEGTMGMLLRDPKLYDEMVFTIRKLKEAVGDIQALVQKLQEKGLWAKG